MPPLNKSTSSLNSNTPRKMFTLIEKYDKRAPEPLFLQSKKSHTDLVFIYGSMLRALDSALYKKGRKLSWELLTPTHRVKRRQWSDVNLRFSFSGFHWSSSQYLLLWSPLGYCFLASGPLPSTESSVFVYALTQCSLEIQPFPVTKENLILLKTCQNIGYWLGLLSASLLTVSVFPKPAWCSFCLGALFFIFFLLPAI